MINLSGYCCINQTLRNSKPSIYSSRSLTRKTFSLSKAEELSLSNVKDILKILHWNEQHNIKVFRIGSEPLPRASDPYVGYTLNQLTNCEQIKTILKQIGKFSFINKHHLSFHPGQFVCLGSPKEAVRQLGILALERENEVAQIIAEEYNLNIPINIHIGGSYNKDYVNTANRFISSFKSLSPSLQSRLTIENDDSPNEWSVQQLYKLVYQEIGCPIVFDIHHWKFNNSGSDISDDFSLAQSTWNNKTMQVHYSESADPHKEIPAHSDYISNPLPNWLNNFNNFYIHIEAKQKELAILKYKEKYQ